MNSLSWLIYTADVASGVGSTLGAIAFAGGIAGVSGAFGYFVTYGEPTIWSHDDPDKKRESWAALNAKLGKLFRAGAITCACAMLLSAVVPNKDTIYAIAASEMGERAMQTKTADKAIQALNAWLDRQIKPDVEGDAK